MPTVTAVATLAALALVVVAIDASRRGARSDRRFDAVLRRVDDHLEPVSEALQEAAARAGDLQVTGGTDRDLAARLELRLDEIAAEGAPAHAFRRISAELAPRLGSAPVLANAKQPPGRDELTGVRDRDGYEAELEREIARARRTERPLALVLLDLGDLAETRVRLGDAEVDCLLQGFAELLVRATRATDSVCRRRGGEFGILLPETTATGARVFRRRLREETASRSFGQLGPATYSTGVVEWLPGETPDEFEARARMAVAHSSVRALGGQDPADGGPRSAHGGR